jgi:hypothetical protein
MLTELCQITGIISNICIITITVWLVKKCFQVKKYFHNIYMDDIDNLLNQAEEHVPQDNKMKERLIQVVASGKSKQYLGKLYSTDEIEKLDEKEIAKLYARYEAVLGGQITATLKQHIIFAYTRAVEVICPAVSQGRFALYNINGMCENLNNGPFIDLALTSLTCRMYHDYGHLLAPLEAVLLTSNFVQPANQQAMQQQAMPQEQQQQQAMSQSQQLVIQQMHPTI